MISNDFLKKLENICREDGSTILLDEPLPGHTTISVGGSVRAWIEPETAPGLKNIMDALSSDGIKTKIVGEASNILFPDGKFEGAFINLKGSEFTKMGFSEDTLTSGGGIKLASLLQECAKRGLSGMESLIGIPGSLGGALIMNASYKKEISEHLVKVLIMDSGGKTRWLEREKIKFGYRSSSFGKSDIVIEAVFKLEKDDPASITERMKEYFSQKQLEQPLDKKSLGCVFKNPLGTKKASWQLIDEVGLRGASIGGASVSRKHANFIINTGGAKANDVKALIGRIKEEVDKKFSVILEEEIVIL